MFPVFSKPVTLVSLLYGRQTLKSYSPYYHGLHDWKLSPTFLCNNNLFSSYYGSENFIKVLGNSAWARYAASMPMTSMSSWLLLNFRPIFTWLLLNFQNLFHMISSQLLLPDNQIWLSIFFFLFLSCAHIISSLRTLFFLFACFEAFMALLFSWEWKQFMISHYINSRCSIWDPVNT